MAFSGLCAVGLAGSDSREGDRLVKAVLIAEQTAAVPGKELAVGIHLTIEPKWHVYWRNNGDTGMPVSVQFEETPGVTFGEVQWPAPIRYKSEGEMLDYVHEGQVTLIVPAMVGADVRPGTTLDLRAKIDWLVCKDLCLPGEATVTMSVPVAVEAERSADAAKFEVARRTHPRVPKSGEASWEWDGATLAVRVPGAKGLAFLPYESEEGAYPEGMFERGAVEGETIRVAYAEDVTKVNRVRGVIEVTRGEAKEYLLVDTEGPGPR